MIKIPNTTENIHAYRMTRSNEAASALYSKYVYYSLRIVRNRMHTILDKMLEPQDVVVIAMNSSFNWLQRQRPDVVVDGETFLAIVARITERKCAQPFRASIAKKRDARRTLMLTDEIATDKGGQSDQIALETAELLEHFITTLPDHRQELARLLIQVNCSTREAAEAIGVCERSVQVFLRSLRSLLHRYLVRQGIVEQFDLVATEKTTDGE